MSRWVNKLYLFYSSLSLATRLWLTGDWKYIYINQSISLFIVVKNKGTIFWYNYIYLNVLPFSTFCNIWVGSSNWQYELATGARHPQYLKVSGGRASGQEAGFWSLHKSLLVATLTFGWRWPVNPRHQAAAAPGLLWPSYWPRWLSHSHKTGTWPV